jgi:hypothetical protein
MEVGVIIGAGIGVSSTGLAGWWATHRDDRIRREQSDGSRRDELQQAMRAYLAAIDSLSVEMTKELVPSAPTAFDQRLLKLAKITGFDFLASIAGILLQRAMYGNRHNQLLDRLTDASAHLRLVAPPAVEDFMIEGEALTKRYRPNDEAWMDEWKAYRDRMRTGFRAALDQMRLG